MSPQAEPAYRTAYVEGKGQICPECGHDFTSENRLQVLAHIEGYHPGYNASLDSDGARERAAILQKIASEKE